MLKVLLLLLTHPVVPILHWAVNSYGSMVATFLAEMTPLGGVDAFEAWTVQSTIFGAAPQDPGAVPQDFASRRMQQGPGDTNNAWHVSEDTDTSVKVDWVQFITQWFANAMNTIVISIFVTFWYKSSITDKRDAWPIAVPPEFSLARSDWKYGTFQCCDNPSYCLYGCGCPAARMGDTYSMAGIAGYWTFVIAWACMYIFAQLLNLGALILVAVADLDPNLGLTANLTYFISELFLAYWLATKRQELRQKLGDTKQGTFMMDWLCYWCCACCTAIQEGRQVDEATYTVTQCCMQLVKLPRDRVVVEGTVVGVPVAAAN